MPPPPGARRDGKSGQRGGKGFRLAARSGSHTYKGRGTRLDICIPHMTSLNDDLTHRFIDYCSTKDKRPTGTESKSKEGLL